MAITSAPPGRSRQILAAGVLVAVLMITATGLVLNVANWSAPAELYWGARWTPGLWAIAFGSVGALIAARVGGNMIGWLFLAVATLSGAMYLASEVALAIIEGGGTPHPALLWYPTWSWIPTTAMIVTAVVLFPTGRPGSRFWHLAIWLIGAFALLHGLVVATADIIQPYATASMANPYAVDVFGLPNSSGDLTNSLYQVSLGFGVFALVARRREADETTRQQLRWIAYAGVVLLVCILAVEVPSGLGIAIPYYYPGTVAIAILVTAVPITMGIAVLRYRLYEIDRIISRTLSYGLVMVALASVYVGTVLVAQGLFTGPTGERSPTIVAGSTLLVAALFQPVRRRVQLFVDRRFNRRVHDATRVVSSFSERLRDEVEIGSLVSELRGTVSTTVQPAFVSIWTASSESDPDAENLRKR